MVTIALPVIQYIRPVSPYLHARGQIVPSAITEITDYYTCLCSSRPKNYYMFTRGPEKRGDVNDVIYDADGTCMGRYGCVGGPPRNNMGP